MKYSRSALGKKYQFDLNSLIGKKTIDAKYSEIKIMIEKLFGLKNIFYKNKINFALFHKLNRELSMEVNKLANYISNNANLNVIDQKWEKESQRLQIFGREIAEKFVDMENILIQNKESIRELLKLKEFKYLSFDYEETFRFEKHILPSDKQLFLLNISRGFGGVANTFSTLVDGEFKFADAKDSKGKINKVNHGNYSSLMKSMDRKLRENVYKSYWQEYFDHKNTLATTLHYNFITDNDLCKIKKYDSYVQAALFDDYLTVDNLKFIYKMLRSFKPLVKEFHEAKKKHISRIIKVKVKDLKPWDTTIDLVKINKEYKPDEAQKLIQESLSILGDEYSKNIQKAFTNNWIDWFPQEGKYSGAYSIGESYGLEKKYILMNYNGTLTSVSTLAHELGHSMHSYFSDTFQPYEYAGYPIIQAEVASIANECLLNDHLLKTTKSNDIKLNILANFLDEIVATLVRQCHLSEYEYTLNEKVLNKIPLAYDDMAKIYCDLYKEYYGKEKKPNEITTVDCVRIPHFYSGSFYVYKYCVGMLGALAIFGQIKDDKEKGVKNLLTYLKAGCSDTPLTILKNAGCDLLTEKPFENAKKVFKKFIEEFKKCK